METSIAMTTLMSKTAVRIIFKNKFRVFSCNVHGNDWHFCRLSIIFVFPTYSVHVQVHVQLHSTTVRGIAMFAENACEK